MKGIYVILLRIVAISSVVAAIYGIYHVINILLELHPVPNIEDMPYFSVSVYIMLTVCLLFHILLIGFGIIFWRGITKYRFWFLSLFISEITFYVLVRILWRVDDQALSWSVAGATGITFFGFWPQIYTLFPIWACLIVFLAHSNHRVVTTRVPRAPHP